MIRFYFENLNGICSHDKGVGKGKYFASIINKLEVDLRSGGNQLKLENDDEIT